MVQVGSCLPQPQRKKTLPARRLRALRDIVLKLAVQLVLSPSPQLPLHYALEKVEAGDEKLMLAAGGASCFGEVQMVRLCVESYLRGETLCVQANIETLYLRSFVHACAAKELCWTKCVPGRAVAACKMPLTFSDTEGQCILNIKDNIHSRS